ncbi:MAG TPA: hypothetical protein VKV26_24740 [Dehalococcoidia bacterium]|nr:hypothetical protein [Dehalococcoidia bacterium]
MFILKGCPKCKGDLAAESSRRRMEADDDVTCIQCGYHLRPDEQQSLFSRLVPVQRRPQPLSALAAIPVTLPVRRSA